MVKADLIESISKNAKLSMVQAKAALNAFLAVTSNALKKGQNVKLEMFGTFMVAKRKERKGVHPKTGLPVIITARKVVKFIASPFIQPKKSVYKAKIPAILTTAPTLKEQAPKAELILV
jgi:DNA-binding protein HU-beta